MPSDDVMRFVNAATVAETCQVGVCCVGSREVSEKARALVLIRVKCSNDTKYCSRRLPRSSLAWIE